jgi:hypothetical protein
MCVRAWCLAEGDVLPSGARVVSVQRDPTTSHVVLGTDDGAQRALYCEDRLIVVHRPTADIAVGIAERSTVLAGRRLGWRLSRAVTELVCRK